MPSGYLFGYGALLLFWILSRLVTGRFEPWALALTEATVGGRPQGVLSASKFQALIWTLVTLFAYASVFGARLLEAQPSGPLPSLPEIPLNLLVLMGLSVATAAGSKGVAISYKSRGLIGEQAGGLVTNRSGEGDLVKTQMLIWTVIGAGIYLLTAVRFIAAKSYVGAVVALPDVDGALLVLMGVSQGSYFGNKLVTRDVPAKPKLERLLPAQGPAGSRVTLVGDGFGDTQATNFVSLNNQTIRSAEDGLVLWGNLQIDVTLPAAHKTGDKVAVEVYCNGEWSDRLLFEVT